MNSTLASRFTLSWVEFSREKRQTSFELDEDDPGKGGFLDHRQEIGRLALRSGWSALDGYFRLSYMDARDRINDKWVDRRWSQTYTINTGLQWLRESYSLGVAVTWHSGWRSSRMPASVSEDVVLPVENVLNNAHLDDYFSLDVTARKHWKFPRWRVEIYADLVNVTDRGNQAGIDYDIEEVDEGYLLTPDQEALLGRVPSVGITVSFQRVRI